MSNDIDFDELDRAVSSLLGKTNTSNSNEPKQPKEPAPTTAATQPPQNQPVPEPVKEQPPAEPSPASATAPQPQPMPQAETQASSFTPPPDTTLPTAQEVTSTVAPAAAPVPTTEATPPKITGRSTPVQVSPTDRSTVQPVRRAGRFMDVVHPSSDMAKSGSETTNPAPQQTVSPRPVAQQPARLVAPEITPVVKPVQPPKPTVTPVQPAAPAALVETPESKWSDSLNFLNRRKKPDNNPQESTNQSLPAKAPEADPVLSPFLSDAKVEKRPLGAFVAPGTSTEKPTEKPVNDIPATSELNRKDDRQRPANALPPELREDLVAIEAGDPHSNERPDTPPALPPENTPAQLTPAKPHDSPSVRQALSAAATLSIPQQYKTKPADDNAAPHAMFDVDQFQHPLLPAGKKKKGALFWITMIFLLLLVGAAIGVGLYYLNGGFN
ncbi:MAG TPA: hypothetical protein VD907_01490 [Verrucomicrobiae bacterium]|nr:hypothetical protein [Verrucomicrobiae bacterium]